MARVRFGYQRKGKKPLRPSKPKAPPEKDAPEESAKTIAERLRAKVAPATKGPDYRRFSLNIHGWLCAKCGRDFDEENLHLLTVHHKDGNSRNNPPDGSNWENLCAHCHEDEHSRGLLGNYLSGEN
jgi:hypothetical protein